MSWASDSIISMNFQIDTESSKGSINSVGGNDDLAAPKRYQEIVALIESKLKVCV